MKKFINLTLLTIIALSLSSCSFIPRLTFSTPGTVPKETQKSLRKIKCAGTIILNENGTIKECTKGFYEYTKGYSETERKYTIMERVSNFIRTLSGFGFWGLVIVALLCPSLLGLIVGRIFNGANTLVDQLIRSIKKFRQTSDAKEELDNILRAETDEKTKKIIATKRVTLK